MTLDSIAPTAREKAVYTLTERDHWTLDRIAVELDITKEQAASVLAAVFIRIAQQTPRDVASELLARARRETRG